MATCLAVLPAFAQYPGQVKPNAKSGPDLRAVAVIEWTGDLRHPKASRVIPISVWDGTTLQDAGIYLARPEPLALQGETEYVLQKDGRQDGLFDIQDAANQGGTWIGFGKWKPLPRGPSPAELARERASIKIDDAGDDEPILHRKYHPGDSKAGSKTAGKAGSNASAPDPDRPHLGSDDDSGSSTAANGAPPPDPDRPRLTADDNASAAKPRTPQGGDDQAHVSDLPNISDPDRPRLAYGRPAGYQGPDLKPAVMGLPPDMRQQVAVSDLNKIQDHPWDYTWANPDDALKMKTALEQIARKDLGLNQPPPPVTKSSRTSSTRHKAAPPPPSPAPVPFEDEQFRVLELTYGSGATMVFSAHTKGAGGGEKFITLIAQPDLYGGVIVLYKNMTDAGHLDVTPRMRLVDAVDAEGDNRGELLFELRGKVQREFALFRVVRGQAAQIFVTSPLGQGRAATAD